MRFKRFLYIIYYIFPRNLPKSSHSKISKWLRLFFAKKIMTSVGKGVNIEKGACFNPLCSIGNNSGVGVNCELNGPVNIGDNVMMGPEVVVYTRNHSFNRIDIPIIEQGYDDFKTVNINDDCWIGRRVIILPGVSIGKGSVIGAGAVISKNVPDYSVVVGNPSKIVKSRKVIISEKDCNNNS